MFSLVLQTAMAASRSIRWKGGEEGQGLAEYGLILVLVSIVVIVALALVGDHLTNAFCQVTDTFGAVSSGQCN